MRTCQIAAVVGPAVTTQRPSGLNAAWLTVATWNFSRARSAPSCTLQRRASPSTLDVRTSLPSGLNDTDVTPKRVARERVHELAVARPRCAPCGLRCRSRASAPLRIERERRIAPCARGSVRIAAPSSPLQSAPPVGGAGCDRASLLTAAAAIGDPCVAAQRSVPPRVQDLTTPSSPAVTRRPARVRPRGRALRARTSRAGTHRSRASASPCRRRPPSGLRAHEERVRDLAALPERLDERPVGAPELGRPVRAPLSTSFPVAS